MNFRYLYFFAAIFLGSAFPTNGSSWMICYTSSLVSKKNPNGFVWTVARLKGNINFKNATNWDVAAQLEDTIDLPLYCEPNRNAPNIKMSGRQKNDSDSQHAIEFFLEEFPEKGTSCILKPIVSLHNAVSAAYPRFLDPRRKKVGLLLQICENKVEPRTAEFISLLAKNSLDWSAIDKETFNKIVVLQDSGDLKGALSFLLDKIGQGKSAVRLLSEHEIIFIDTDTADEEMLDIFDMMGRDKE